MIETFEPDTEFLRDNDSLYVLPLGLLNLETPLLRRSRLVKNARLEPAVETYRISDGSRGIFHLDDLDGEAGRQLFDWPEPAHEEEVHPDLRILCQLGVLPSYDVFSLRLRFREINVDTDRMKYLRLSDERKAELAVYMRKFTLPLVRKVYGESEAIVFESNDMISMFRNPDTDVAKQNLRKLAEKLNVRVSEIPAFLEDFSDVYLSLSYYQVYLDEIVEHVGIFNDELFEVIKAWRWRENQDVADKCEQTQQAFQDLLGDVSDRIDTFTRETSYLWHDVSAARFRDISMMIRDSQATIAGVLCGVGIKINAWRDRFKTTTTGNLQTRSEYLLSYIQPGLERLRNIAAGQALAA